MYVHNNNYPADWNLLVLPPPPKKKKKEKIPHKKTPNQQKKQPPLHQFEINQVLSFTVLINLVLIITISKFRKSKCAIPPLCLLQSHLVSLSPNDGILSES